MMENAEKSALTGKSADRQLGLFFLFWGLTILLVILRGPELSLPMRDIGNDDAMRLVQVRDLLAGQSWFDLTQYRLGLEGGSVMHWSRIVDAPIAALILMFSLFVSQPTAETLAMFIWPMMLIGPVLLAIQQATIRFGGTQSGVFALIFTMIAIVLSRKFTVGALDHHNLQMVLVAVMLYLATAPKNLRNGVLMAMTASLSIAIGFETLPFVVAICGATALGWGLFGGRLRDFVTGFGAGFALALGGLFLLLRPDRNLSDFACDAFDLNLLIIGVSGGVGLLFAASFVRSPKFTVRLAALVAVAVFVALITFFFADACLTNPLSRIDPLVQQQWLARITEAQSLFTSLRTDGGNNFGMVVVPVLAVGYTLYLARQNGKWLLALYFGLALAVCYLVLLYQIRGLFFILLLCVIPIAAMLGQFYQRYKSEGDSGAAVVMFLIMGLSVPDLWSIGYKSVSSLGAKDAPETAVTPASQPLYRQFESVALLNRCFHPDALAPLNALSSGVVLASTDMGAGLLKETRHRILAANFHRADDGIHAFLEVSMSDADKVPDILTQYGVTYVVTCRFDTLPLRISRGNETGMWHMLAMGQVPDYLTEIPVDDTAIVRVFTVDLPVAED